MRRAFAATILSLLGLTGCGEDTSTPRAPVKTTPAAGEPAADCGKAAVRGHEAIAIRADGVGCGVAKSVAAAAEGRNRQPYDAKGFGCEPAEAGGGDTNYTCTRGKARISFRYGTA